MYRLPETAVLAAPGLIVVGGLGHSKSAADPLPATRYPMPPQTLAMPLPPQVSGDRQVPQSMVLPQPSAKAPQLAPTLLHVRGVHGGVPQVPGTPPPPQV